MPQLRAIATHTVHSSSQLGPGAEATMKCPEFFLLQKYHTLGPSLPFESAASFRPFDPMLKCEAESLWKPRF